MSDPALPKIKVVDTQNPDGNAGTGGASALESPSTTTDGGQSQRPKSATSSEGQLPDFLYSPEPQGWMVSA
jgi:hypothetical protein